MTNLSPPTTRKKGRSMPAALPAANDEVLEDDAVLEEDEVELATTSDLRRHQGTREALADVPVFDGDAKPHFPVWQRYVKEAIRYGVGIVPGHTLALMVKRRISGKALLVLGDVDYPTVHALLGRLGKTYSPVHYANVVGNSLMSGEYFAEVPSHLVCAKARDALELMGQTPHAVAMVDSALAALVPTHWAQVARHEGTPTADELDEMLSRLETWLAAEHRVQEQLKARYALLSSNGAILPTTATSVSSNQPTQAPFPQPAVGADRKPHKAKNNNFRGEVNRQFAEITEAIK
ncbi:hypothetical protein GQ54DRAFT_315013, partial [Martensiomyces pterosporus]